MYFNYWQETKLSYATEVWFPESSLLKQKAKKIQRRATKWILRVKAGELSYKERLQQLDMLPLAYDREVKDLMNGYIDIDVSILFTLSIMDRHVESIEFQILRNSVV